MEISNLVTTISSCMIKIWFISKILSKNQNCQFGAMKLSLNQLVEGFFLHHLDRFRGLWDRFGALI